MGLPMARNLIKAGFHVVGVDISQQALNAFAAAGGVVASTPAEAIHCADTVLIVVVDADQTEAVLFGNDGIASALAPSKLVIASATMAPSRVAAVADRLAQRKIQLLDAPISGGIRGAAAGALTVMVAGPDDAYAKAEPILRALAARVFHIGKQPGQASTVKLINQLLCGIHLAATAEAVALAERAGVPLQVLYDIISASSGTSRIFEDRAPDMWSVNPPKKAAVDIFVKDLGLVLELARTTQIGLTLTPAAHQVFEAAADAGLGRSSDSEIVQVYRQSTTRPDTTT
jgi:3-hydroxyisobutyrate dehydrogenase